MKRASKEWTNLSEEQRGLITEHQTEWPVKVGGIAKDFGLVVKVSTLEVGISGIIEPHREAVSGFKVSINKHEPKHRQRFTLAHEIAHFLLHRELIGIGLEDNVLYRSRLSDDREVQANNLASDILMPRSKLREWIESHDVQSPADYICDIASDFEVSEEAMRIALGMKK